VIKELELNDLFDLKFVIAQNDKAKTSRVLGDDENIYSIFSPTSFIDKLMSDKKEI